MKVLDLFCGGGGASVGLKQAWPQAEITGVDSSPQPRYPFTFVQADALTYSTGGFDFIWASPMCQAHSWASKRWGKEWPEQIPDTRKLLEASGASWVIENVVGAPLMNPMTLCGQMFNLKVIRHRLFESSFPMLAPFHPRCTGKIASGEAYTVAGHGGESKSYKFKDWCDAMGIHWMNKKELTQSIPPAFSEYIARQFSGGLHAEPK